MSARRIFAGLAHAVVASLMILASATSASAQGLIRDAEIEGMLREFGEPLFEAAGLRPEAVSTYVINDPSMNAFVAGGQNIFMHTGIIVEAETPLELKGVLAHETGHIEGGHLARIDQGARRAMGPMLFTMAAGILAAAAGEGGAAAALLGSSQQFGMLAFFQYTQGQESAADQAAIRLLEETGTSPEGLLIFFDRFRYQEVLDNRRDPYFRTHPLSSARVEALRPAVEKSSYADVVDSPEHVVMLERAKAKIYGFLYPPMQTFRHYPETDTSIEARYARAIAHHKAGSIGVALELTDGLIDEEPTNAYFHELKGQILFENGRIEESITPFRDALDLAPDAGLIYLLLAQALIETRDDALLDEAEAALTESFKYERDNAFGWRLRALMHERRGETALAQLATAEQRFYSDPGSARAFAARARDDFPTGSTDWLRANDIIAALDAMEAVDGARRRR